MSDLLDALASEPVRRTRPCDLGHWVTALPADEAEAIRAELKGRGRWNNRQLAEIISTNGHPVSYSTIANHRRRECRSCR